MSKEDELQIFAELARIEGEDTTYRERITAILEEIGAEYFAHGLAIPEVHQGHDVHAFYALMFHPVGPGDNDPRIKTVHIQGYPGMSNRSEMRVYARLMDTLKIQEARAKGNISIGNEHEAVVQAFPNFQDGINIPYSKDTLQEMLEHNIPLLG